jgi:DnaJ family protein C protein 7
MSRPEPMDVDRESTGAPSSPSTPAAASAAAPQPAPQTAFSVPIPNGLNINTAVNGTSGGEDAPMPPPHKSNPSSPVPTTEDEAEAYKAAGNRFFKDKDFKNAIVQYSKGMPAAFLTKP